MNQHLFARAKWAFSTRRATRALASDLDQRWDEVAPGQFILGQVISIGQHGRMQLASGRPSTLYPGDLIVMPCGARYAPDQFEGIAEIDPKGCDMLAGGGCLGRMMHRNDRIKPPTRVQPLGRITAPDGQVLDTLNFALPRATATPSLPVIVVLGTAMNSGKTTATVALSHGLTLAGWRVATLKGTGTGSFGDFNHYLDAGSAFVADFTDAGMVTTYREPLARVALGIRDVLAAAEDAGCDLAVMEIADGIFQRETAALIADPGFRTWASGVIFACGDAVAAAGGVAELARQGVHPLALTGLLSCSPMASAEALAATGVPVINRSQLLDPAEANRFAVQVGAQRVASAA
ncbi:hypothetical protein J2Z31_001353 [Sinorhizobium kostiense]|uniref:DUF1611 domain-containing protein n=1 Tax=Sinorhizobium kostiense TaxID=76747 RepID=A0ABS4QW45_9HYPH|nr:DUF1611 domain-containing protein [Sinorhizobium kostiense]MBP2234861.1 hypothetical protein [Sinorhizobium kostiense]